MCFTGMRDLWLAGSTKEKKVRSLEYFSDASFWYNHMQMPQFQSEFIRDTRKSDRTSQFRTSQQLDADLSMEEYSRPETDAVFQFRTHMMLDCIIVTIESHTDSLISSPFYSSVYSRSITSSKLHY